MSNWTAASIDSLSGKTVVITGGTSGIGLATVNELVQRDAFVIIGADDEKKGEKVLAELKIKYPEARVTFRKLDLGSIGSIFAFVNWVMLDHPTVDILINNAGISAVPQRTESADGHELVFAVNYLGHFVLTAQLFPLLLRSRDPRVVSVSSLKHKSGRINFEDMEYQESYRPDTVYTQSKLALLMFALELHRLCQRNGVRLKSVPVHPGALDTEIFDKGSALANQYFHPIPLFQRLLIKNLGQKPEKGALPILFAATSVEARSGILYGPDGPFEIWGNPTEAKIAVHAENMLAAKKLWEESEKLSGIRFEVSNSKTIGLH